MVYCRLVIALQKIQYLPKVGASRTLTVTSGLPGSFVRPGKLNHPKRSLIAMAWAGDVSAVILIALRTYRLIFRPDLMPSGYQIKPID